MFPRKRQGITGFGFETGRKVPLLASRRRKKKEGEGEEADSRGPVGGERREGLVGRAAAAGPARALGRSGEEGTLGCGGGQAGQGGSGLGQTKGWFPLFFFQNIFQSKF